MTPISPPSSEPGGFTLMEMLVVLGVLSLLAVIAAGNLDRRPGALVRGQAAEKLAAAIDEARWAARSSGAPQQVLLAELVPGVVLAPALPSATRDALVFRPDGSSEGGVVSLDGRPLLRVNWLTGETSRAP